MSKQDTPGKETISDPFAMKASTSKPRGMTSFLDLTRYFLYTLWLFTLSDLKTFVLPETLFGILGAFSGLLSADPNPDLSRIAFQVPKVILWTWLNTLVFDLANQRHPESIMEDQLNKPFRPLAAGRITPAQTKNLLLVSIPAVLALTYFYLGSYEETVLLFSLTWMYNDLGGSDGHFVVRNLIIGVAYIFYGSGAFRVALKTSENTSSMNKTGYAWSLMIGAVIFTTMQVQDLKDQVGDLARDRHTAPLVLGHKLARWTIAVPVVLWSLFCSIFWKFGVWISAILVALGLVVAVRVVYLRCVSADKKTWKLWSYWLAVLYFLPVLKRYF